MKSEIPGFLFSKRHVVALLIFFGMLNMFALRANLSIAIVEMTSSHSAVVGNETVTMVWHILVLLERKILENSLMSRIILCRNQTSSGIPKPKVWLSVYSA